MIPSLANFSWGRFDDFSFSDCSILFYFVSIEFHCTIHFYKIGQILFIVIVFWLGSYKFWFLGRSFFCTQASLLTFFWFLVLFHSSGSHVWVFWKTIVHEFLISNSHIEWYLVFIKQRNYKCTISVFGANTLTSTLTSKPIFLN